MVLPCYGICWLQTEHLFVVPVCPCGLLLGGRLASSIMWRWIQPGEMLSASVTAGYEPALLGATSAALLVPAMLVEPDLTQPWKMLPSPVTVDYEPGLLHAGAGDVSWAGLTRICDGWLWAWAVGCNVCGSAGASGVAWSGRMASTIRLAIVVTEAGWCRQTVVNSSQIPRWNQLLCWRSLHKHALNKVGDKGIVGLVGQVGPIVEALVNNLNGWSLASNCCNLQSEVKQSDKEIPNVC